MRGSPAQNWINRLALKRHNKLNDKKSIPVRKPEHGMMKHRMRPVVQRDGVVHWLTEGVGLSFFGLLHVVEALGKQQVGDLLNDRQRVGDTARPEGVPDLIDLITDLTG